MTIAKHFQLDGQQGRCGVGRSARKAIDWLTLGGYEQAKEAATRRISGDGMTREQLDQLSLEGDAALRRLNKRLPSL